MFTFRHWPAHGIIVGIGVLMIGPGVALAHADIAGGYNGPPGSAEPGFGSLSPAVSDPTNVPVPDLDLDFANPPAVVPLPDRDSVETIVVPPLCEFPLWLHCPPGSM